MTTVIDFGPVDWGKIWGERASLVSPQHLNDLNAISAASHLSNPGYWRNLFASYPEVISRAGFIANHYVRPGQTPKAFATSHATTMITPQAMNIAIADRVKNSQLEHQEFLSQKPPDMFHQTLYSMGRDSGVTAAGEKAVTVVKNVGTAIENVGTTAANLVDAAKNLTNDLKNVTDNSGTIYVVGALLVGSIIYANVK